MKKTNAILHICKIAFLAIAVSFSSCKKKSSDGEVTPVDLSTERDLSNANNDVNSVLRDVEKTFESTAGNLREESSYATISRMSETNTKGGTSFDQKTTITYSETTADDGQTRSGTTIIYHTGSRLNENLKCFVEFTGTKVGGRTITGTKTIVQVATGDSTKWQFNITGSGSITTIDGNVINYSTNRIRVRTGINPKSRFDLSNDTFSVTGSWEGTNAKGDNVSATITSPLLHTYSCNRFREITAGKIDFTNKTKNVSRTIDYGSGGCDGIGKFIQNGKEFTFFFKR